MKFRRYKPLASAIGLVLGLLCAVEAAKGKPQDAVFIPHCLVNSDGLFPCYTYNRL